MIIRYSEIKQTKPPVRANPSDAGLDVFCGEDFSISIDVNENRVIRTGLKFEVPHGYMLMVCNRGSMAAKSSLVVGAHIVDSGYSGELFIDLHNIGTETKEIQPGQKIAQLVMVPVVPFIPMLVPETMLYSDPVTISAREEGAFGSTGS